jgi:succinate dehydrogenase/fumarate reductase flavoprotein subunit
LTEEKQKPKPNTGITRRQFVTGTVGGLIVGAAAGAVTGSLGFPKTVTEKPWLPATWDYTADIVVVGFGFAGQASAITAHDAGASVIVLEKTTEALSGGNSRVCGQCTWVPGTKQDGSTDASLMSGQLDYFKAMADGQGFPVPDDYLQQAVTECAKNKTWLEGLGATTLYSPFPQPFYPQLPGAASVTGTAGGSWSVKGTQSYGTNWFFLKDQVTKRGINVMYETPAKSLIQNPETMEILGVVASSGGKDVNIKANKAVILAAGGYEYAPQMVRDYLNIPEIHSLGSPSNTGDGIMMASAAGAGLWHMDVFAAPTGWAINPSNYTSNISVGTPTKGGFIFVGADSKRFDDELYPVSPKAVPGLTLVAGKYLKHGVYETPPYPLPVHMVFDQTAMSSTALFAGLAGLGWALNVEGFTPSKDNSTELANGWIIKGDTIQDLATAIGKDPTVLSQEVTNWNTMCAAGTDTEYGRTAQLVPVATPPYYAIEIKPMILNTQGGPTRNTKSQVLDTNGNPIPRLYAAGEMGEIFSYLYQCCRNVSLCYTMGRIAATDAASLTAWQ